VDSEEEPLQLLIIEILLETKWEVAEVQEHQFLPIKEILLETKWEVAEVQELKENQNLKKKKNFQSFLQDTYKKLKI
jgi:hypothetical protein